MLRNLSVTFLMRAMLAGIAALFLVFSLLVWRAVERMEISANDMGLGKDVVADILPPPLYIIEAELVAEELRSAPPGEIAEKLKRLETLKRDYDTRNRYWEAAVFDERIRGSLLGAQREAADRFWSIALGGYATALRAGDSARAEVAFTTLRQAYLSHREGVDRTVELASAYASATLDSLNATARGTRSLILAVALAGSALVIVFMTLVTREIMRRLGGEPHVIQGIAQRIANGDLRSDSRERRYDADSLMAAVRQMRAALRSVIGESNRVSAELANAAQSLTRSSSDVAAGSSKQNEAAIAMSAAVEEVSITIENVADSARRAKEQALENLRLTSEGSKLVQRAIQEIRQASETVSETGGVIEALGEKSSRISSIVEVIKSIAEQTNLLALNAAIEAARAGDQGRGFAVVADEVRSLAARTAQSTQEITGMIAGIQQGTENAVQSMEKGRSEVAEGVDMAQQTGTSVDGINRVTEALQIAIGEISRALTEQSSASRELAESIEMITRMSDSNVAAITTVSDSARHLESLATGLNQVVGRFQY